VKSKRVRGFSRGEEIRYNEIRLSFVLFHDKERKEGDEVPFFQQKKTRERAIFFAHTHAKRTLKFFTHKTTEDTGVLLLDTFLF